MSLCSMSRQYWFVKHGVEMSTPLCVRGAVPTSRKKEAHDVDQRRSGRKDTDILRTDGQLTD